ncbi:Solute carrier family 2 (facilitated glucose transporter)-like protein 1 [Sarcoptes scabiei]|uniref:Solute carrier family 2 (Facilitated glucose transporter)-like protein 1 n=1 Tax=Sarcoptes scabiei TaxID=52283 RepID=A0A132AJZ1_SARSC|nr:Solute carrier family 2 (facilitated glucose transporter)-like protein 1 [Sarcoptes scabiei]
MSIIKTILSRLFPFTDYPRRSNHQYVLLKHHNQSENDFEKPKNLIERSSSLTINLIVSIGIVFLTNSFVSGFNIGVLNTIEKILVEFLQTSLPDFTRNYSTEIIWSLTVSILIIGAMLASIFAGHLANSVGSLKLKFVFFFGSGTIFSTISVSIQTINVTAEHLHRSVGNDVHLVIILSSQRLIAGFHTGLASTIVPMYLMEISPKRIVSSLGTIHVLGLNSGIFVAQLLGLENFFGSRSLWPWLFIIQALILTLGLMGQNFLPESPKYLFILRNDEIKTVKSLQQLRCNHCEISEDLLSLRIQRKINQQHQTQTNFWRLIRQKEFRQSLMIICALHAGQQLIGINAIFYYSTGTFLNLGFDRSHSQYGTIGCSLINTICALLAAILLRKYRLRSMLLFSTVGTTISLAILVITMTFNTLFPWLNLIIILAIYGYSV